MTRDITGFRTEGKLPTCATPAISYTFAVNITRTDIADFLYACAYASAVATVVSGAIFLWHPHGVTISPAGPWGAIAALGLAVVAYAFARRLPTVTPVLLTLPLLLLLLSNWV